MPTKRRVLILCTGNSCRSQMAEGWINHELGGNWEAYSAGTRPEDMVHPLAVRVMAEVGIDISLGRPQSLDVYLGESWELVITVCDSARESCPVLPGTVETLHISFPDPASAEGSEDQIMTVFRSVRDGIRDSLLPEVKARSV
jgi:arsenate reductase